MTEINGKRVIHNNQRRCMFGGVVTQMPRACGKCCGKGLRILQRTKTSTDGLIFKSFLGEFGRSLHAWVDVWMLPRYDMATEKRNPMPNHCFDVSWDNHGRWQYGVRTAILCHTTTLTPRSIMVTNPETDCKHSMSQPPQSHSLE